MTAVDVIDSYESFAELEDVWTGVQENDPEAGYFLSWRWFAEVFRANPGRWRVLAVRSLGPGKRYVAFLPLEVSSRWSSSRRQVRYRLEAAGRLSWAQQTGFVCEPGWERKGLRALAVELQALPWSRLSLEYCAASHRRLGYFLDAFDEVRYRVSYGQALMSGGTVDNLVCPYVRLPADFDTYLKDTVSANTRQKIRRYARRIERSCDLRITLSTPDTFDRNLNILLDLWARKWTPRRGAERVEEVTRKYRQILSQSQACEAVFLPVLWRGTTPLGAVANIVDRRKRHVYFIVAGRDEAASDPFIGLMLHADSIRWAIENGFDTYDFCHGNEPYKYSFGATDRRLQHVKIRRRSAADSEAHR